MLSIYGRALSSGPSKKDLYFIYLWAPKVHHVLMGSLLSTFPVLAVLLKPVELWALVWCHRVLSDTTKSPARSSPALAFA